MTTTQTVPRVTATADQTLAALIDEVTRQGMTLEAVADKAGITESRLHAITTDPASLLAVEFIMLADALGVEAADLLARANGEPERLALDLLLAEFKDHPAPAWATETTRWTLDGIRQHRMPCGRFVVVAEEEVSLIGIELKAPTIEPIGEGEIASIADPAEARTLARDLLAAADVLEDVLGA